ncbi:transcription termination factor NusA [Metamycoplasma buccale]|uniref:transcription termination factor NusA n=1 Tax=Metamycoplasma buccale TaxID=55602 RepID=UPI00398F8077
MSNNENEKKRGKEIFTAINNLVNLRNNSNTWMLDKNEVIQLFKDAVTKVIVDTYDKDAELEFVVDESKNEFIVINKNKRVVEDPESDEEKDNLSRCIEIPLSIAKKIKVTAQVDDELEEVVNFEEFSKKDYIKISQLFNQFSKELEKKSIYNYYSAKIGQVVKARVSTILGKSMILELEDGTPAFMPPMANNRKITFNLNPGSSIDVYIDNVLEDNKNAQVIVSNVEGKLLDKLLKKEIPELESGIIEVVSIARIPGERAKILIKKSDNAPVGIEELGAIIGHNSERILNVSRQLNGEKIDVIQYSDDLKHLIINALSPSKVIDVIENPAKTTAKNQAFIVVVPTMQHTLAIGKKGQNVTLASEIAKVRLDIISQKEADEQEINYDIKNGNITLNQIEELNQGKRLHSNFKKKQKNSSFASFNEGRIDMTEFESDIAELRSQIQNSEIFEKQILGNEVDNDLDIEATLAKVKEELDSEASNDEIVDNDPYSKQLTTEEDYAKITKTKMKDFKEDKDLSFGLDDIDLSDLDNEDW